MCTVEEEYAPVRMERKDDYWRAGASQPSRTNGTIFLYIYIYLWTFVRHTVSFLNVFT